MAFTVLIVIWVKSLGFLHVLMVTKAAPVWVLWVWVLDVFYSGKAKLDSKPLEGNGHLRRGAKPSISGLENLQELT